MKAVRQMILFASVIAIILAIVGFGLILLLEKLAVKKD